MFCAGDAPRGVGARRPSAYVLFYPVDVDPPRLGLRVALDHVVIRAVGKLIALVRLTVPLTRVVRLAVDLRAVAVEDLTLAHVQARKVEEVVLRAVARGNTLLDNARD